MRRRTNARKLAEKFRLRAYALPRELERAAKDLAPTLKRESQRVQGAKIYAIPIPIGPSGRPLWTRTKKLRDNQRALPQGMSIILTNPMPYASARYKLGLPGERQPVYTLSVQWQHEAIERKRPQILSRRRKALLKALRRP